MNSADLSLQIHCSVIPQPTIQALHQGSMSAAQGRAANIRERRLGWVRSGSGEPVTRRQVEMCAHILSAERLWAEAAAAEQRRGLRSMNSGGFRGLASCSKSGCFLSEASLWRVHPIWWEENLKVSFFPEFSAAGGTACAAPRGWTEEDSFLPSLHWSASKMEEICTSVFGSPALSSHKVRSNLIYGPAEKSAVLTVATLLARNVFDIGGTLAVPQKCRLTQIGK